MGKLNSFYGLLLTYRQITFRFTGISV